MNTLEHALKYGAWGWPVFPANGKIPLIPAWPETASTDEAQIAGWWEAFPKANVGIVTGPRSGLLVLDLDGTAGEESLARLTTDQGELPQTLTAKTGRGWHFYFQYPEGLRIGNDHGRKLGTGLDVKGAGGFVVAPPSRHQPSGKAYAWQDIDTPPANPPGWLIDMLLHKPEPKPLTPAPVALNASRSTRYAEAALTQASALIAKTPEGQRNDTLNAQAYGIGQLIGANALDYSAAEGRLMDAAMSAGLPQREAQATIQGAIKAGMQEPRNLSHIENPAPPPPSSEPLPRSLRDAPAMALQSFTAAELLNREFQPPRWAIPTLLPEGLTILAGRPKTGKSWLAFDIALAVARGSAALGNHPAQQGGALYLALEDHERRLQDRLLQLVQEGDAPDALHFTCGCPRFDEGGLEAITAWLDCHPECRLIVLDTLGRFKPPGRHNGDAYGEDTAILASLQRLALDRKLAFVVVHHTRKATAEKSDPLDEVLGSTGLTGAADAVWVLRRARNEGAGSLFVTGRDIEEQELAIEFDATACTWSLQLEPPGAAMSAERQKILDSLAMADAPQGPKQIAEASGLSYASVRHLIRDMEAEGSIHRKARGQYMAISRSQIHNGDESQAPRGDPL